MSQVIAVQTAIEKSTKTLVSSEATLSKTVAELTKVLGSVDAVVEQVQEQQAKLDNIAAETKVKVREAKVELDLQVKENEAKVLADLMKKAGYAVITTTELNQLNSDLDTAKADNSAEVSKAVAIATNQAKKESELELLKAESAWKEEKAELVAQEKQATQTVAFLEAQVKQLQETITAERQARVEIAQAESNKAGVTVNTTGK